LHSLLLLTVVYMFSVNADDEKHGCKPNMTAEADKSITIGCPVMGEIFWSKGGSLVATKDKEYLVVPENRTLTILKVDQGHSGDYVCYNGGNDTATLTVCVRPYVQKYDKPKNVIEGDPFQVECRAWGYPAVTVEWTFEKNFTDAGDRLIFKNGSAGMNSILRIENMKYEDGGEYTCTVTNVLGTNNATIQVNVKDKLAALWPFLGICAEVAILCVIIFLYERRRAKRLEKEANMTEETDHMTANNDTKVSDDVRHRK